MEAIDFSSVARQIQHRAHELVPEWLPGGKLQGREYVCGDINGGAGTSFSVNMETGAWADFATDQKGGDLISLYAEIRGIKQIEAVKELGYTPSLSPTGGNGKHKREDLGICPPPATNTAPDMKHPLMGMPNASWSYRTPSGDTWFYVCRWDNNGEKTIRPLAYSGAKQEWVWKSSPKNRPLYNLHKIASVVNKNVLIVEGEKAADAAQKIVNDVYVVTTWPHGSNSVSKTNWADLKGRKVLVWPDNDKAGRKAEQEIRKELVKIVAEYKYIEQDGDDGKDAADYLEEGMTWGGFVKWAKPLLRNIDLPKRKEPKEPTDIQPPQPEPAEDDIIVIPETGFSASPFAEIWAEMGLTGSRRGPHNNINNAVKAICCEKYLGGQVWWDEFHQQVYTNVKFTEYDKTPRPWANIDDLRCAELFQQTCGLYKMSDEQVAKAISVAAHQQVTNEPRDWMESLKWDGESRIGSMLTRLFGSDDTKYHTSISRNFWISMVARIYDPGCQVDNMIYFKGKQGIRKTTALRIIGGKWYSEAREDILNKDFYLSMRGKMLIEIGELNSFSKTLQGVVKQVVSCRTDTYRAPYERRSEDHPRQCIFAATTNEDEFSGDETGMRRFWPAHCRKIDVKTLEEEREQLFAEAVFRYKRGDRWHETPISETAAIQESYRRVDEWENVVTDFVSCKTEVTIAEVWTDSDLAGELKNLDKRAQMRIAGALRANGFVKKDKYVLNDVGDRVKIRCWVRDPDGESRHEHIEEEK